MNLDNLLLDLSERGVTMWVEEGQLRMRAPKGVLNKELQDLVSKHKSDIVRLLNGDHSEVRVEPVPRDQPLKLSFMQERLWFLAQMYPSGVAYNLPNAYRLRGVLDINAFTAALQDIVARHEALRTTFSNVDGEAIQCVAPEHKLEPNVVDLCDDPAAQRKADQIALEDANHAFDLENGPLFLCRVLRLEAEHHLLLWTIHHIVADGWSSMIFLRELKTFYEARIQGERVELPPTLIQYADFAAWERGTQQGDRLEQQLDYWREKLTTPHPILELPTDHPRPSVLQYCGSYHSFAIPAELSVELKKLSAANRSTLFTTLLTAYKLLLQRYSQQDDICVGSPIARRNMPEIENVFGCFINSLPLRTDLSGDPTFGELLTRVTETCSGAFRYQDVPFEQVLEVTGVPSDTSRTPLFQVMFILHVQDTRKVTTIGEAELTPLEYHTAGSKFDLTLELKETADGLEGFFEYSTDLFDAVTIERLAEHYQVLLAGIVSSPQSRLSQLPLLTEEERRQQLEEWNATQVDYPVDKGVHQLFSAQALRTPSRVAVSWGKIELSYEELDRRSNQLARYLLAQGVSAGAMVGLCLERSSDMVVALLGVLKTGAVYVPLDPAFPADRLQYMLEDAAIGLLLTQESLCEVLPAYAGVTCLLDTQREAIEKEDTSALEARVDPQQLAYVIYTSGSTGKPKGVQIPHRALTNFLCTMAETPGITDTDTLLAVTTLSFDIAGLELFLPLLEGARVVVASKEEAADGTRLAHLLEDCKATVMQATPSTWRLLLESGWVGVPGLKILCGGEALPRDLAEQILGAGMELWNMYGPTETTIWSAVERVESGRGVVSIGRPIANTGLYVLGEGLELLPAGAVGELYIGGDGLAQGYLNRPELTAERFVDSPFEMGAKIYRTGDLARYLLDGRLEVLGRTDQQVKVRGYRIELGEIESVLLQHAAVQDAVVIVREDVPGDKRIVAYLILAGDEPMPAAELRGSLQQSLPEYMLPSAYVPMESFPQTPNRKVDRKALPAPDGSAATLSEVFEAPRDELDQKLAAVWSNILGVDKIGITDDFFDLGGHSLLAMRLVSDMERVMHVDVPLVTVFQGRNIKAIRELLSGGAGQDNDGVCIALNAVGRLPPFFAGGSHPGYNALVEKLNSEQPFYRMDVYALQSRRIEQGLKPLKTIEEIAREFVKDILRIQPEGPYYLGGGCEGGIVAFEVARQLQVLGETICGLMIWVVEAPQLFHRPSRRQALLRLARQIWDQFRKTTGQRNRLQEFKHLFRHERVEYAIFRAAYAYRPETPFQGRILLARHYLPDYPDLEEKSMGWSVLATEGAEVVELPGNHQNWLPKYAEEFAKILSTILPKA